MFNLAFFSSTQYCESDESDVKEINYMQFSYVTIKGQTSFWQMCVL